MYFKGENILLIAACYGQVFTDIMAIVAACVIILYVFGNSRGLIEQLRWRIGLSSLFGPDSAYQKIPKTSQTSFWTNRFLKARVNLLHSTSFTTIRSLRELSAKTDAFIEVLERRNRYILQAQYWWTLTANLKKYHRRRDSDFKGGHWKTRWSLTLRKSAIWRALSICWTNSTLKNTNPNCGSDLEWRKTFFGSVRRGIFVEDSWSISLRGLSCKQKTIICEQFDGKTEAIQST